MGINNIVLSNELVASLYPDSLVLTGPAQAVREDILPVLGQNKRKITFVVHAPDSEFLPEDQLAFLGKILAACHCKLADIALVNAARSKPEPDDLRRQLNPSMLFVCGVPDGVFTLPVAPEPFTVTRWGGISLLVLPALESLQADPGQQSKKKLWICLQQMFTL